MSTLFFYFLFLQIIQAFSFGGEYPTVINYLTNHSPKKEVARTSSLIVASSIVGVLLSIAIVETLKFTLSSEAMQSYGWRIPLLIGGINIAVSFWFRSKLPKEVNTVVEKTKQSPRQWIPLFFISMGGGGCLLYTKSIEHYFAKISRYSPLLADKLVIIVGMYSIIWLLNR
ncbi:MFS transporter [Vibrio campbellii]|uniref:MFS transporter n=1 Tax=Vibrio campbellii TaxID=680 RepID=UPI0034E501EE